MAWPDYMRYTLEKVSNGWMSGENLVCRLTGTSIVLIQTRQPGRLQGLAGPDGV